MPSGSIAVAAFAIEVVVAGSFGSDYQVTDLIPISATYFGDLTVIAKTPTSFTFRLSNPAPAAGMAVDWSVNLTPAAAAATSATYAGTIVNNVRDDIPDPVYDSAGNPQPDGDGLFRAQTMYRWLNTGVQRLAQKLGQQAVVDWFAFPQVAFQPWYAIDPLWITVLSAFANQWPIDAVSLVEEDVIWPSTSLATSQSLWGYFRKRADHLEFGLWPVPTVSDPSTTLAVAIGASGADPIQLVSTLGFLSYGYVKIDSEIIQYQRLSTGPTGIRTISRGVCGTTAAAHLVGATVQHLGVWVKGKRGPATIASSASLIELPVDAAGLLETYLLGRCRGSEQEFEESAKKMAEFANEAKALRADPVRQESVGQIRVFGEPTVGPLAWGGRVIRP